LSPDWKSLARHELLKRRLGLAAWGYQAGGSPSIEPTALASLGVLASGDARSLPGDLQACRAAADWMAAIQRADGALPVSQDLASPGWATGYALLLWSALSGYEAATNRAFAWLLGVTGKTLPRSDVSDAVIGRYSSAAGWPWVDGTHSWLEPTALAVLALCQSGRRHHPRVAAGIELILDRALAEGGWNYGNRRVFGRDLRPQPGPTGLALLALAAFGDRSPAVARALEYLLVTLPRVKAAVSLGWGVLGLRAHRASPPAVEDWLAAAAPICAGRSDATTGLALLLLASSNTGSDLITCKRGRREFSSHSGYSAPNAKRGRNVFHATPVIPLQALRGTHHETAHVRDRAGGRGRHGFGGESRR
jgi:hypothetical protein